jgi:hypothetical protein
MFGKPMRKLIRDTVTKRFLMENGQWNSQDLLACDFHVNTKSAGLESTMMAKCEGNLEWFYAFDCRL